MLWKYSASLIALVSLLGCALVQTVPVQNLDASPMGKVAQFFYETQGGKAEGYLIRPKGVGRFPLMVLLHGDSWRGEGATRIIPAAEQISNELCYASLAVSLPGYGMTEVNGDSDKRKITLQVIADGIAKVRALPWIDPDRVMIYGFSRGAVFAAALADEIKGLRSVVLHSGAYDIGRLYQETPSQWIRRSINPNGENNPSLFSVLPEVSNWNAPALILHGGNDPLIPASQAYLLRDRLQALGKPHRFVLFPNAGHRLPADAVRGEVLSFLNQTVGSACRVNGP